MNRPPNPAPAEVRTHSDPVTPAASPTPAAFPPTPPGPADQYTALEAIQIAQSSLKTRPTEKWLITAEAKPELPGGRLGAAQTWQLLFRQLGGPLLRVDVEAAGTISTRELPGGNWAGGRTDRFRVDPVAVAHDSIWAIRIADAVGGAKFLSRFPGTRRSIVLDHQFGSALTWTVEYQTPDSYWTLTYILDDATGRILHRATCEYTPAAMARPAFPNCDRDFEPKDPPAVPLVEPGPDGDVL